VAHVVTHEGCKARVPDHTDFMNCGDHVLRGGRCAFHLHEEVVGLQAEIKQHEEAIATCNKRLAELQTESG
jgi:hypothetical protein